MSTAEPTTYTSEPSAGRSPRTIALIVVAVLVAAVIGGGAFAVARMLGGGGDQPAAAMPAGTSAYVKVDIDPGAGQKLAALDFVSELEPEMMEGAENGDLKREIFEPLLAESPELSELTYADDIEPWLGDRVGLGLVSVDGTTEPVPVLALQATDTAAAGEAFDKIGDDTVGWYVSGDYIVALPAEHRDAVLADVEAGTLADSATFSEDLTELGEQGVASGWLDLSALSTMTAAQDPEGAAMGDAMGEMGLGGMGMGSELAQLQQGRVAMTVRFVDEGIELAALGRGTGFEGLEDTDTPHLVGTLPADTFLAMGLEHGDQWVDLVWSQLEEVLPEELATAQEEASAVGFELPGDLKVLLGDSLAVSADPTMVDTFLGTSEPTQVPVAYRVSTDTARAQELLDMVYAESGMSPEETGVLTDIDGDVLTIAGGQDYLDAVTGGGDTLGDSDLYTSAVADAQDADFVLFADLNSVEDRYLEQIPEDEGRDALALLAAIGMSSTMEEDGDTRFTLRVVTD